MNSRRPLRSLLTKPLNPIQSGKAAFSLKKGLFFFTQYSDAGLVAGVFFGYRRRSVVPRRVASLAEVLHK
jgi:hypothetical protein